MTGTDLIAKDILHHKAVTRRDETRAKTLDRLREKQEETGGSSAPQAEIRTEISQQLSPLLLPLTTWNKGSFIVAKLFDWRRFAERK